MKIKSAKRLNAATKAEAATITIPGPLFARAIRIVSKVGISPKDPSLGRKLLLGGLVYAFAEAKTFSEDPEATITELEEIFLKNKALVKRFHTAFSSTPDTPVSE